jgi:creatinine amidohydrolase
MVPSETAAAAKREDDQMKPPTVFLGEMTNPEVEAFLRDHDTVIVPVGSVEQHGPHGPLLTDVVVPNEVARRVAPRVDALVAPPINYGLSYPHVGFTGVVHIRVSTFMTLVEDVCVSLADAGFKRIVLLNGHYDNTYALAYACATAAARMPKGVRAYPINYWDGMTPDESSEFFGSSTGLHANRGETSAVLAINPAFVDMDHANDEMPPFPPVTNQPAVHTAFFFSTPGSVHRATHSGTWGDAREATAEFGERYLGVVTEATVRLLDDIERTFAAMPAR